MVHMKYHQSLMAPPQALGGRKGWAKRLGRMGSESGECSWPLVQTSPSQAWVAGPLCSQPTLGCSGVESPLHTTAWQGLWSAWWQRSCFTARARMELCPEAGAPCDPSEALAMHPHGEWAREAPPSFLICLSCQCLPCPGPLYSGAPDHPVAGAALGGAHQAGTGSASSGARAVSPLSSPHPWPSLFSVLPPWGIPGPLSGRTRAMWTEAPLPGGFPF